MQYLGTFIKTARETTHHVGAHTKPTVPALPEIVMLIIIVIVIVSIRISVETIV